MDGWENKMEGLENKVKGLEKRMKGLEAQAGTTNEMLQKIMAALNVRDKWHSRDELEGSTISLIVIIMSL